jgi:hypothetical protein
VVEKPISIIAKLFGVWDQDIDANFPHIPIPSVTATLLSLSAKTRIRAQALLRFVDYLGNRVVSEMVVG